MEFCQDQEGLGLKRDHTKYNSMHWLEFNPAKEFKCMMNVINISNISLQPRYKKAVNLQGKISIFILQEHMKAESFFFLSC